LGGPPQFIQDELRLASSASIDAVAEALYNCAWESSLRSLMPALRRMPAGDVRNWPVIHPWAAELAKHLQATGTAAQS
jgi:hypothetical protein